MLETGLGHTPRPAPRGQRSALCDSHPTPRPTPHSLLLTNFFILLAVLALAGCNENSPPEQKPAALPLAGLKLRLVVAGDPAIAAGVRQLRDQWNAETGSELEVQETTPKELLAADRLPGDAVICPSDLLATLGERNLLAPVPAGLCHDDAGPWSEIFDLLRLREATWATRTLAVPLGAPVLCCYYRADLLEKLGRQPPRTWREYLDLAHEIQRQAGRKGPRWATIEPLGPGWAGLSLLAHAAPYAVHPDYYSTLFDIETMEPLVAGPPWVRALEELVEAAKLGPPEQLKHDPAAVRTAFWNGQCGLAVSWPTAARDAGAVAASPLSSESGSVRAGVAELPGSSEVYNVSTKAWESRPDGAGAHVPLLGMAGRIGVVRGDLEPLDAAFHLLFWLSDTKWSPRVSARSPATTLFRRSQTESPRDWVEPRFPAATADAYAHLTVRTLSQPQNLWALRLPGRAEYLAALDEAVRSSVRGLPPAKALADAANRWRQITDRLGRKRQQAAYLHGLGLQ